MCWLILFLCNKNWQISLEGAHDSALTVQPQTAELCLVSHDAVTLSHKLEQKEMQGKEVKIEQGEGGATSCHKKQS